MTSRERVLAALGHRTADKVPIDFAGHRSSGIAAIAYAKLREALGLPPRPVRVYDPIQQLAIVDDDVLERFHVDTIELGRGFAWTTSLGRLGSARRHPLPDAGWALPERRRRAVGLAVGERQSSGTHARRRALLRTMLLPLSRAGGPRTPAGGDATSTCGPRCPARRDRSPTAQTACAGWPRAPARCAPRPIAPSSDCSAATCSRSASSSTATTTSSCCWPANPSGRTSFSTGWWRSIWATSSGSWRRWAIHRHHRLRRRPGNAERAANFARHVPRVLQAAPRPDVAAGESSWPT